MVYCASGVMPAVSEAAEAYEREFGIQVRLQPASSGVLEQQIKQTLEGDLYIPAGKSPFLDRCHEQGLVAEIIPLAGFRLVIATQPGNPKNIQSLEDLLRNELDVVLAEEAAAVGKATRKVLKSWSGLTELEAKATTKPTVNQVGNDIRVGVRADAGFIWDATARQMKLEIVNEPWLRDHLNAKSVISAGVLTFTKQPAEALRFARYLAAPEKGQRSFEKKNFSPIHGDPWAVTPQLSLFSGGVNRNAIKETLTEFEEREGCKITSTFQGCGSLVTMMKAGQMPDAYFACDVSFVDQVSAEFHEPIPISTTDMVMLVRPGNPKNIERLEDLSAAGLRIGLADEKLTALGRLTVLLLQDAGVADPVLQNLRATTPTADLLVAQLTTADVLDAVIVYRANCSRVGDTGEIIKINHPIAKALQPLAIQRQAEYPQLAERFMQALISEESQARFEKSGFRWQYSQPEAARAEQ